MKKVLFVFGTRPEAVKLAPVILEFKKARTFKTIVALTGQHRQMLDQMLDAFGIRADIDLDLMVRRQTLAGLTASAVTAVSRLLDEQKPDLVVVQGDTTTVMAASMAAFYARIPVAHVEAGLRSFDFGHPFPEEFNRIIADRVSTLHFAATPLAKKNLLAEGIPSRHIYVTGNTVVDALKSVLRKKHTFQDRALARFFSAGSRHILVTAHRRESFGRPLEEICRALLEIVRRFPDVKVVYPVHLNPNVQHVARRLLAKHPRILLAKPAAYLDLVECMRRSYLILTDSGGIQEEAPTLGKPVLVLRKTTERPEAVLAGSARLLGEPRQAKIVREVSRLLKDRKSYKRMAHVRNPFGDGKAAVRILRAVRDYLD
ncbi:MAG: UDP-N-acetylglucosamine 2-epimerase (non-hydrolyzing) [Elusimicrobiota bacterium]